MVNPQPPFPDLTQHWARSFINRLQRQAIVSGFRDGTFRPEQTLTRAEYAALLRAAFQRPPKRAYLPFKDVSTNFWAFSAIQNAYEAGFISGFPDNTFRPQAKITRLQVLLSLVAGLNIPKPTAFSLAEIYTDAATIPNYAVSAIAGATESKLVVTYPQSERFDPDQPATRAEVAAIIYQALVFLGKALPLASPYIVEPTKPGIVRTGTHISVNGRGWKWKAAWGQWNSGGSTLTGISDKGMMLVLGMNPLNTSDNYRQPVNWFSPETLPYSIQSKFDLDYRYLNIDELAKTAEWEVEIDGNTLNIFSAIGQVDNITYEEFSEVSRMMIDLNQPTPWELYELSSDWEIVVDAIVDKSIADRFVETPPESNIPEPNEDQKNEGETGGTEAKIPRPVVKVGETQTTIKGKLPDGYGIKVFTLTDPNRIGIEIRKDPLIERKILWSTGLNWRQEYLTLNQDKFPVVWLEVQPNSGLKLKPIWTDKTQMKGTASLSKITETWGSLAAINGGYFNRNNLLPLGAIRKDNQWLSGPILNRGSMAWNDAGSIKMARLKLIETLTLSTGREFEIDLLNTGYVKAGIARYTTDWGSSYTPLTLNEVLIIVENNQITRQIEATDDKTPIAIPTGGYILSFRSFKSAVSSFPIGAKIAIAAKTTPSEFNQYPHILGAGPLLLQQNQIVVDPEAEGFNIWFSQQRAIRSAIGVDANGNLLIVTVHNRVGGPGPDLTELAKLIQQLGAGSGLNLDGGSSTSLILGGHLLNRTPDTAARVHNGLGLFWR
ncbi:S-layer homology domain-containing protein [Capilliphycus salinus ALCB114379]|uniref:S-layer homology domain-containing protein n=1 Tax=Capilliphycus salinus TaxID=2768948 RepID=UPI0039A6FC7D